MKKIILTSMMLSMFALAVWGCSTDTHYDSVSTEVRFSVKDLPLDGATPAHVRQRFQFDRDLQPLSSMTLAEAWLSAPSDDDEWLESESAWSGGEFTLDIVKSILVSMVVPETNTPMSWLVISSNELKNEHALFTEYTSGDLREYLNQYDQLEVEVEVIFEPYYLMNYWRDVCDMSQDCRISLPFSMQFKMVD